MQVSKQGEMQLTFLHDYLLFENDDGYMFPAFTPPKKKLFEKMMVRERERERERA